MASPHTPRSRQASNPSNNYPVLHTTAMNISVTDGEEDDATGREN